MKVSGKMRKVKKSNQKFTTRKKVTGCGRAGRNRTKPYTETESGRILRCEREKGLGLCESSYYTIIVINLYRRSREWRESNGLQFTSGSARRNRAPNFKKMS